MLSVYKFIIYNLYHWYKNLTNLLEGCLHNPVGQGRPMAHFPSHTSRANAMVS